MGQAIKNGYRQKVILMRKTTLEIVMSTRRSWEREKMIQATSYFFLDYSRIVDYSVEK